MCFEVLTEQQTMLTLALTPSLALALALEAKSLALALALRVVALTPSLHFITKSWRPLLVLYNGGQPSLRQAAVLTRASVVNNQLRKFCRKLKICLYFGSSELFRKFLGILFLSFGIVPPVQCGR